MKVTDIPISLPFIEILRKQGYDELYPPQEAAVKAGVLEGKSLILATPTASGKTLVAIMAAANVILRDCGKVVYLTPLRALANEKHEEFKALEAMAKPNGEQVRVSISTGDYDSRGEELGQSDIILLTNEKFDSLLRHGVMWIDDVNLFVADEMHLVGDSYRGPTIETILTKIISMAPAAQILALSATASNAKELAGWLRSGLIDLEWRPVRLVEGVYVYGEIFFSDKTGRKIDSTNRGGPIDLAIDTIKDGGQSLIFAETRRRAVSLAQKAAEAVPKFLEEHDLKEVRRIAMEILSTGEETETGRRLAGAIERGSAFHHAGLDLRHRRLVEDGFRRGLIKVLTATPTLAAGVNLPARRVVLSSLYRYDSDYGGPAPLSVLDYKQMCGRAGRPKFDTVGETVILARTMEEADDLYMRYVKGKPEPIRSQLARKGALRTHVLSTIVALPGISEVDLMSLFSKTLMATQLRKVTVRTKISEALGFLTSELLIEQRGKRFLATEFGKRISMLYIDPATGIEFRRAVLRTEEKPSNLTGLLHLITIVPDFTPKFPLRKRDWVEAEAFLDERRSEFLIPFSNEGFDEYGEYLQSFRTLMTLWSWIHEASEEQILDRHGVEPGDLHRAVESSNWLLHSLAEVCKILGQSRLLGEIVILQQRVSYGVKPELLQLTTLDGVGRVRARSLYSAGYTDLKLLRAVSIDRLAMVTKIGSSMARNIKKQLRGGNA
jgi:helicase